MKQMSEMGSKAGILQQAKLMISKSASFVLIAMAGFSMMSFTQDDVIAYASDTNLNQVNHKVTVNMAEECCAATAVVKPGDEFSKIEMISHKAVRRILTADVENSKVFVAEAKERMLWSLSLSDAFRKADNESAFNFQLSKLVPDVNAIAVADEDMHMQFESYLRSQVNFYSGVQAVNADVAAITNFVAENFSISAFADARKVLSADAEMISAFEKANLPFISVPSQLTAAQADAAMHSNQAAAASVETTIAVK